MPSQRFSIAEFQWDHPFDCYIAGTIQRLCWYSDEVPKITRRWHIGILYLFHSVRMQCCGGSRPEKWVDKACMQRWLWRVKVKRETRKSSQCRSPNVFLSTGTVEPTVSALSMLSCAKWFHVHVCCVWRPDEFGVPAIGEFLLIFSNGVYEPIKWVSHHFVPMTCVRQWLLLLQDPGGWVRERYFGGQDLCFSGTVRVEFTSSTVTSTCHDSCWCTI